MTIRKVKMSELKAGKTGENQQMVIGTLETLLHIIGRHYDSFSRIVDKFRGYDDNGEKIDGMSEKGAILTAIINVVIIDTHTADCVVDETALNLAVKVMQAVYAMDTLEHYGIVKNCGESQFGIPDFKLELTGRKAAGAQILAKVINSADYDEEEDEEDVKDRICKNRLNN